MDPLGRPYDDEDEGRICARSRGCGRPRDDGGAERGRDVAVDSARAAASAAAARSEARDRPRTRTTEIYSTSARQSTYAAAAVLGVGLLSPNPAFSSMLSTFALSGVIGYQVLARCATGTLLSAPAHV